MWIRALSSQPNRRRCWNKTLKAVLTVIGKEDKGLDIAAQNPTMTLLKDQSTLLWQRDGVPLFAMATGWGDRSELESSLGWLEAFKCPQKLFVYTCSKWQDAVLDQIRAALLRYPYHVAGEQYLFMNLVGPDNRFHLFRRIWRITAVGLRHMTLFRDPFQAPRLVGSANQI